MRLGLAPENRFAYETIRLPRGRRTRRAAIAGDSAIRWQASTPAFSGFQAGEKTRAKIDFRLGWAGGGFYARGDQRDSRLRRAADHSWPINLAQRNCGNLLP